MKRYTIGKSPSAGKYAIIDNVLGRIQFGFDTREEAEKRLKQIKAKEIATIRHN